MNEQHILGGLDPEVLERVGTRRDALFGLGKLSAGLALASVPLGLAAMAKSAFAQGGLPQQIVDVLNFALTLEYLEAEFYTRGLNTVASAGMPASTIAFPNATARETFRIIRDHENAHVDFLRAALGSAAVAKPNFDFTAGGAFANVFSDYATFITLAQAFEDTGVRAYKGQAGNLIGNKAILQAALTIHSVEARHASKVRRMAVSPAEKGWIETGATQGPAAVAPIYAGEDNTTQGGVNVTTLVPSTVSAADVAASFDEPLTRDQVLAIVRPFIAA